MPNNLHKDNKVVSHMSRYYVNVCRTRATKAGREENKTGMRKSRKDASVATMIRRTTVIDKHVMHVFANTVKRDRQADRGTHRLAERRTDRQRDRGADWQRDRKIERGRDRWTDLHDFVDACDDNLLCSIWQTVMRDPVTLYQSVEALDMHIYYPKGYSMQSLLVS